MTDNPIAESVTDVESAAEAFNSLLSVDETPKEEAEESAEEIQEESPEVEESQEESSESVDHEAEEESETHKFESVQELAEALEVDVETLLASIKDKVKVNGEESEVTLAELKAGYQKDSDYRQKTMELAEQRKAFETERQQMAQALQARVSEAGQLIQSLESQLVGDYNAVNWAELRELDPAEYTAKRMEFAEKQQHIQHMKQSASQEAQRLQQEAQQTQQAKYQEYLAEQQTLLNQAIPEWQDNAKATEGKKAIFSYLTDSGYTPDEINMLADHRTVVMARKAMLYDQSMKSADLAKKKVSKAPKLIKPGNKPSKGQVKSQQRQDQLARLKKTGSVEDAAALFMMD